MKLIPLILLALITLPDARAQGALTSEQARLQYFAIKRAVSKKYASAENFMIPRQNIMVTFDCGYQPFDFLQPGGGKNTAVQEWAWAMLSIAKGVVQLRQAAKRAGYPDEAWKASLVDFEEAHLSRAVIRALASDPNKKLGKFLEPPTNYYPTELVVEINKYRKKHKPTLPALQEFDGCGEGGFDVKITSNQSVKQLKLIPIFFARVCESTGILIEKCPYWVEVAAGKSMNVSGAYRYQIYWNDGSSRSNAINFDKMEVDAKTPEYSINK